MSDDASYAAFLQKANSHVPQFGEPRTLHRSLGTTLYLTSESDEPWEEFSLKADETSSAKAFASLVNVSGDARYVHASEDSQYIAAMESVVKECSLASTEALQCVEIENGTRIAVYIFHFDKKGGLYHGLKSKKIQS